MSAVATTFRIGVDFGGVLSQHDSRVAHHDPSHVNTAIDMPGAIQHLLALKQDGHLLFLISFCGKSRAIETKASLERESLPDGQPLASLFQQIFFVKDRKYKKQICEYLNCHFMIDDRADILDHIATTVTHTIPIHFGQRHSSQFRPAPDWETVTHIIHNTPYFHINHVAQKPTKVLFDL